MAEEKNKKLIEEAKKLIFEANYEIIFEYRIVKIFQLDYGDEVIYFSSDGNNEYSFKEGIFNSLEYNEKNNQKKYMMFFSSKLNYKWKKNYIKDEMLFFRKNSLFTTLFNVNKKYSLISEKTNNINKQKEILFKSLIEDVFRLDSKEILERDMKLMKDKIINKKIRKLKKNDELSD